MITPTLGSEWKRNLEGLRVHWGAECEWLLIYKCAECRKASACYPRSNRWGDGVAESECHLGFISDEYVVVIEGHCASEFGVWFKHSKSGIHQIVFGDLVQWDLRSVIEGVTELRHHCREVFGDFNRVGTELFEPRKRDEAVSVAWSDSVEGDGDGVPGSVVRSAV